MSWEQDCKHYDECESCDEKDARIKELEENHCETITELGISQKELIQLMEQLKEANEILVGFSGRDGYEKVNDYFKKYPKE